MNIKELIKAQKTYNAIHNEGEEGYNPYDALIDAESKRLASIPKWTKEQTQANREAWNNTLRQMPNGTKLTVNDVMELERKHGFTLQILKSEIIKHNL